ncbi:MAG: ComEC/Rec2 family competence protein [Solirubrobacteraceae bacterium]
MTVRCFSPPGYVEVEEALDEDAARRLVHENCGVYRLSCNGVSVMLAGDSNLPAWQRIVGYYEGRTDEEGLDVLSSQVLHASHHGSRTFVMDDEGEDPWLAALEAIAPQKIVISVGEGNQHDHPHEDMVKIYVDAVGAQDDVLETRDAGTLVMTVTDAGEYELQADPSYAERYGWDDDGGSKAASETPPGGGGRQRRPPAAPPPGYEETPQRAPRRERYAH